jgi:hypothetical protein
MNTIREAEPLTTVQLSRACNLVMRAYDALVAEPFGEQQEFIDGELRISISPRSQVPSDATHVLLVVAVRGGWDRPWEQRLLAALLPGARRRRFERSTVDGEHVELILATVDLTELVGKRELFLAHRHGLHLDQPSAVMP